MDLTKIANPYDFANPVDQESLFIGRETELRDIRYYLLQGSTAARPINIAITGDRASGKTSLLNMTALEAEKQGFCTVRVELDEGDAESQLSFFFKLFDSILTSISASGALEGLIGQTYTVYRDMVDSYEIPTDKTFCPFVFPMQYASAMSKGNVSAALTDTGFKRDMTTMAEEAARPIAILFDECNVLAESRVHLQKLRNIFMNTKGYMLVLTGTQALFPVMDEVFSPIVRQFKKINVTPFQDTHDTEECIRKPLENIGIKHPSEIFDFETYRDVREIHELTGGRPYEIQLICHFLFRRVQEGRASKMQLGLDVLEDVRRELETSQDVYARPVLTAVQHLDRAGLRALDTLCACNGRATFDQLWFSEFVFHGEERWSKQTLGDHLTQFEEAGVVSTENNLVAFAGDDFDRVYSKYWSRNQGVPLAIQDTPFPVYLRFRLDHLVKHEIDGIEPLGPFLSLAERHGGVRHLAESMSVGSQDSDIFESAPTPAEDIYWTSLEFRDSRATQILSVALTTPWVTVQNSFRFQNRESVYVQTADEIRRRIAGQAERAQGLGGNLVAESHMMPVVPFDRLIETLAQTANVRLKDSISYEHVTRMTRAHTKDNDDLEAVFHGELAVRLSSDPEAMNNLGYLYVIAERLADARPLLEKAVAGYHEPALPIYNLGVLDAKEHEYERALARFDEVMEILEAKSVYSTACLILPKTTGERQALMFEEVSNPDLLETARSAATAISQLLGNR